jgi:hypothetical protein
VLPGEHAPAYRGLLEKYLAAFRNQTPYTDTPWTP